MQLVADNVIFLSSDVRDSGDKTYHKVNLISDGQMLTVDAINGSAYAGIKEMQKVKSVFDYSRQEYRNKDGQTVVSYRLMLHSLQ